MFKLININMNVIMRSNLLAKNIKIGIRTYHEYFDKSILVENNLKKKILDRRLVEVNRRINEINPICEMIMDTILYKRAGNLLRKIEQKDIIKPYDYDDDLIKFINKTKKKYLTNEMLKKYNKFKKNISKL